jgi:FAD/FMN-containing dehydrogenase
MPVTWRVRHGFLDQQRVFDPGFGTEGFDRLRALKTRYDPGNVLHRNSNIPPL